MIARARHPQIRRLRTNRREGFLSAGLINFMLIGTSVTGPFSMVIVAGLLCTGHRIDATVRMISSSSFLFGRFNLFMMTKGTLSCIFPPKADPPPADNF